MMQCRAHMESWALCEPFEISREVITDQKVVLVELIDAQGRRGFAEAAGVDYDGETPQGMLAQLAAAAPLLSDDLTGQELLALLPPGGARNALDCALWDLRAKQSGVPVWQTAGMGRPGPLTTAYTIGLGDEASTRRRARHARQYPLLKLKVDAQRHLDVVRWVRQEHPAARIVVDANQAWNLPLLRTLLPLLEAQGVELVEQPLPRGADAALAGLNPCIPLAADESCTDRASLEALVGRYQYINIKLDKCGGLTEALAMVSLARSLGLQLMVGNMCGSSLAMAPAFLIGQACTYVDLDGPLLQSQDWPTPLQYCAGQVQPPVPQLWG